MGNTDQVFDYAGIDLVHPHMHGEYDLAIAEGAALHDRFTPTCMGNTSVSSADKRVSSVHPHMHGEYDRCACRYGRLFGSPPHAWGIRFFHYQAQFAQRFTPTCMGNTVVAALALVPSTVHPHMHGEYSITLSKS